MNKEDKVKAYGNLAEKAKADLSPEIKQKLELAKAQDKAIADRLHLKDLRLAHYAGEIENLVSKDAENRKHLAEILGHVEEIQCYKEDGFASVAEFAEKLFGIKRASAYQLAKVGQRFYNQTSDTAKAVSALLTPSNLAEIANMTDADIQKCIEDGTISADSTQSALRETAKAHKEAKSKNGGAKVVKAYDIKGVALMDGKTVSVFDHNKMYMEDFAKTIVFSSDEVKATKLSFGEGDAKVTYNIQMSSIGQLVVYTAVEHKAEPKQPAKPKVNFTESQLLAMLEELRKSQHTEEAGE